MFIKGFGVLTVPLAATTKYPSAMEIYGLQMWYSFFDCATSIFSCSILSERMGVLRATRLLHSYSTIQRKPGIRHFSIVDIGSSVNIVACTTRTAGQKIFSKIRWVTAYIDGLSVTTPYGPLDRGLVSLRFVFIVAIRVCM